MSVLCKTKVTADDQYATSVTNKNFLSSGTETDPEAAPPEDVLTHTRHLEKGAENATHVTLQVLQMLHESCYSCCSGDVTSVSQTLP